jgi:wobble nucleotide-excising tRNase
VVQHFGRPSSACPPIELSIKRKVENLRVEVKALGIDLDQKRVRIETLKNSNTDEAVQERIALVEKYNSQVVEYNAKVTQIKQNTDVYNAEVKKFNACIVSSSESL